ncbi:PhoH family protein [Massiliimalia timonensis]|uniref:PhoH-like protein n=1 Tax=Massiliimalia timonensis TaxID=1987501 RepID=A0A8J6P6J2_9FIRM|nr:PhoH family protein [Massiliimalia timonensis]MBC8610170.1 PhoH family protein [Massiliimalia timonensis]
MAEKVIHIENTEHIYSLFGDFDENLKTLQKYYHVNIVNRGSDLKLSGEEADLEKVSTVIDGLLMMLEKGETINEQNIRYVMNVAEEEHSLAPIQALTSSDCICLTTSGKPVKPKTVGQKRYVEAIRDNTVVFGVGPAGTGKTYLAVAMAVRAFKAQEVNRIILTRPAVEAGESLGFLPGDLQTKVDPYLRPLYDALFEMLGEESFNRQLEKGTIEVAPLAYMRGRSLNDSFIILDEAQNTTVEQMKMFLTRLGFNSKAVITGDITQIDLPGNKRSGLIEVLKILKHVDDIAILRFNEKDVVRSKIVQDIIRAYEKYYNK